MNEKKLESLGFQRTDATAEDGKDWYYFSYDFGNGSLCLISNASDEAKNDGWYVEVFEDETIRFTDTEDIAAFIELIERNTGIKK